MIVSTNVNNPNALKLIVGAKVAKEPVTVNIVSPNETHLSRLPTLELPCGTSLFSWSAALQYLIPLKEEFDILVNKWLEWDVSQLQPALVSYGSSGTLDASHKPRIWSLLTELNAALNDKKYLITDNDLTLVDVSIWSTLWCTIAVSDMSKEIAKEFANVERWLNDIETLDVIQESLGEFKMERGLKAVSSIQAVTWFPLNSYTGGRLNKSISVDASSLKEKECEAVSKEEIEKAMKNWSKVSETSVKEPSYPVYGENKVAQFNLKHLQTQ